MNLFDNILNQSKNKFLGTQPSVPSTPSFATPQAPRTVNYTAPQVQQKPSMTLFSDEQQMFQKMKADNLDDNTAYSMLKKRRMDILGWNDLGNDEKEMLLKMQADNVPVKQAVSMIQQRRKDQFNKKYEEWNLLQKWAYNTLAFAAGNLETLAKYSGNTLDFITGGTMGFWDEVNKMEQVTSSPEFSESSAFTAGTYLPDVALAVSPVWWQYLAGAKWMTGLQWANLFSKIGAKNLTQWLMGRSAVVGAGFWATQPILDKWSDATMEDIATGAAVWGALWAVATPVIWKVLKYWQAGYRGGLTGMWKSITRDIKSGVNAITPSGANISTKANRFNANEIREFTKTTGQSPWDFATSRGMTKVWDDAVVEATNLWQKSKDQADEALKAIKWRFRFTDEWEDLLKTTIDDLETRLVNTKSPDSKRISQLKAKYEDSGLTMSEINEVKRAYSNNYKYSFVDAGSESAIRSRNLQDAVRKWQFKVAEENGLTNLKEINKTTQGWKMFADSLSKKIQWSSGNNNVSLTDWIALSGGSPENIALYLGKKLASSDKVKSGAIKLFSKKTKPSIIQASKADIQRANFQKDVNRGVSGVGDRSGGKSLVKPVGLLTAPTGKATWAKNFRVNQPAEKTPIKNEWQVWVRPGSKPIVKPNTIKNESKVNKPISSNTIPEGYFKNAFWEIQKNPSNKKGGFIRNPFAKPIIKRSPDIDGAPTKTAKDYIKKYYKWDNNPLFDELDKITMDSLWFKWSKRELNSIQEVQFDMRRNAFKDEFEKIRKTEWVKTWTTPIFRKWEEPKFYDWNTEKVARERFDIQNLQKLWAWSDRDVYDLWNWKVLKVVKTARWLEQTSKWTDYILQDAWITPKVFEQGRNYVVTEKIKQFKDMDKSERKIINDFIDDMQDIRPYWNRYPDMWKIQEWLEKYGWEDLANYDMQTFWWGDIRKANIWIKNWRPILIDEWTIDLTSTIKSYQWVKNLDDMDFRGIYQASKDIKKKFWDIDANTMYNIAWLYIWWNILLKYLSWDDENKPKSINK